MKSILRGYGIGMDTRQRQIARSQAKSMMVTQGTIRPPRAPVDLVAQSGPRGVLINWRFPQGNVNDIVGWRVYKGDEISLFAAINNPGTTQWFVESTAGTTPPTINIFVSSVNRLGIESSKVGTQAKATAETGAPTMPPTPDSFAASFMNRQRLLR